MPDHTLIRSCPHCHIDRTAFSYVAHNLVTGPLSVEKGCVSAKKGTVFNTLWLCNSCNKGIGIVLKLKTDLNTYVYLDQHSISNFEELETYPVIHNMVPDGVPARIANYYSDAVKTHGMKIYHASGKLCRQVLEFALADRFPKFKGSLYERIKELSGKGMLLTEMASWANEIRELGNDAAHADPFTREEADDIMLLTEYMLVYLYTLPGIIARRALKGSAPAGGGSEEP